MGTDTGAYEAVKESCLNCYFAEWQKTANGRLHPNKEGHCRWSMPKIAIPASRYYIGSESRTVPTPNGGGITRLRPHTNCPTWEEK